MELDTSQIPLSSYGILLQDQPTTELDEVAEQIRRIGYGILDSGYTQPELEQVSEAFDQTRAIYIQKYGEESLRKINEFYTVRSPLENGTSAFINLATNPTLLQVLAKLIVGKFILNQQNGVINPPRQTYNQGSWHRDLPYQHYISSSPLAINALFCVDDFTAENGATFVLPATHKAINCPSESYIQRNAMQVQAKAGQYILLDCMLFHSGGFNRSGSDRRAVNHVYTIPYFKQQIKLPPLLKDFNLTPHQKELFGFNAQEPGSVDQFLADRISKVQSTK